MLVGGLFEESVELFGRKESLEDGTDKDGERRFLFKAFENLGVSTHNDSFQVRRFGKTTQTKEGNRNNFLKV